MKKLLFAFTISLFFISCNNDKESVKQTQSDSTTAEADFTLAFKNRIQNDSAITMVDTLKHYKNNKLKFDGIVRSYFDSVSMRKIYSDPTVINVKFFVGVLYSDAYKAKSKDAPVIILQVTRRGKSATDLPTYEYYAGDSFCPPPNDSNCGSIEL